ncbi:MAG: hypothetical protein LUC95_13420 [Lachnospiraceae bacterium]|nr:hypothetical protein [Lachnospiraceae bacterium]
MNNNIEYEYEIDLKDLCVSLLRRWRQMILAAVIGAVLLGGFRLVQNMTAETGLVMSESELEAAQEDIEKAEKQIKSLDISISKTQLKIEANEVSINNLADKIALAESQLESLDSLLEGYMTAFEKLQESDVTDGELADTMVDYLIQIDTLQSSIYAKESEIGELYESEPVLEEANLELQEQIEDYEEQIVEQEETIAELEEQMAEETSVNVTSKVAVYIVLGAFVGICCVLAYAFLQYCFDRTVHLEEDLTKYSGVPVIASVHEHNPSAVRKRNFVDKLLDRFEGVNTSLDYTVTTQCDIAAAKIQVLSGNREVLLTGTVSQEMLQSIYDVLGEKLPAEKFTLRMAENPMYSSEEILKIGNYDLVLVEAPHITKVRELTDLNSFLRLSGVKVIGIIAVSE